MLQCVVQNIALLTPTKGTGNSLGGGRGLRAENFKELYSAPTLL